MKNKYIDYNLIIGSLLILAVLIFFSYFFNVENKNFIQEKKIRSFSLVKEINKKGESLFRIENEVLKLNVSSNGGVIKDVFLKKYKSYDPIFFSHIKNLFLSRNYSFFYRIVFFGKKNLENISTSKLHFNGVIKENKYYKILIMKAPIPNKNKSFLYHIYKIRKGKNYDVKFFIFSKNFDLLNKFISIDFEQKNIPLEKDKKWENLYTQLYYSIENGKKFNVKYLSEKKSEKKILPNLNWIAFKQQFFTIIINPQKKLIKNVIIGSENHTSKKFLKINRIHFNLYNNKNKKDFRFSFCFYFTPLDVHILKKYNNKFEDIIPFGWGFLGWINKYFFLQIFQFLEKTKLNYGIIIILMTIVVKLLLYPITYRQYRLSVIMKLIKPEIEKVNKKYKNESLINKQKAIMNIYKKVGINPMSGCLSTIFQIPIFYALFKFFPTLINLRGKSFLWVEDLTSYDSILELPFFIPMYGNHVSLLTLLYVFALFIYSKLSNGKICDKKNRKSLSNYSSGPNMDFMLYIMPFIMLLFINRYASALSLYYFTSNIINIGFFFIIKNFINEKKIIRKINNNN